MLSELPGLPSTDLMRCQLMLSPQDCLAIVEQVMALSDHWLQRAPVDFYTLGAASYLDGSWELEPYRAHRIALNPVLLQDFPGMYSALKTTLSSALQAEGEFAPELALPWFHVFAVRPGQAMLPATSAFAAAGGSIHLDLQYNAHATFWKRFEQVDWEHPLSFTLPLQLPIGGGGLNIWPASLSALDCAEAEPIRVDYRSGEMVWFCAPLWHQIAPLQGATRQDRRITLQGHGLRCDGRWLLYF